LTRRELGWSRAAPARLTTPASLPAAAQVAAQLVDAGAGTMAIDNGGRRPFELACGGGQLEALPKLMKLLRPKAPTYE